MHDIRLAFRTLRGAPMLSAAGVLSLALGIGANTAIFSVVDALLLRSLPVPEPHRLVTVSSGFALNHGFKAGAGMSYDIWTRMYERAGMFENGFAWAPMRVDLSSGGEMQPANALFASGGFFQTLGVAPLLGRTFTPVDDVKGGADGPVAVIGYELWQRRFDGAASVLGTSLRVDGVACTIIGVMPPGFHGIEVGQPFDLAVPLASEPAIHGGRTSLHHPSRQLLTAMFRLKRGQSLQSATVALRAMQPDILGIAGNPRPRELPAFLEDPYVLVPAATGTSDRSGLRRQYGRPLLTLLAVVTLVLLVACVNIANLLLAWGAGRRREMSVRLALGATRWRLARASLAESLVLAVAGGIAGLVLALWASRAVVASLSTTDLPVALSLPLDWRVLVITLITATLAAVLFGTAPAFTASRAAPAEALTARRTGASSRLRLSGVFLVLQVALSLVLLATAGFLMSTLGRLRSVPLGFDADRVLIVDVDTARVIAGPDSRTEYFQRLADAVTAVPGVAHSAVSSLTPFNSATRSPLFADPRRVIELAVSPGFFATYGVARRSGRDFDQRDLSGGPRVAVVSESYVRRFLANRHPLEATVDSGACGGPSGPCAIVGVVADVVFGPMRSGARPTIYVPLSQSGALGPPGRTSMTLGIRSAAGAPSSLAPAVGDALMRIDRRLSFSQRPADRDVSAATTQERLAAVLAGCFAVLALLLSAVGLYGVTAYSTERRRAEIGIRLALGATRPQVVRLVLLRILAMTVLGVALGVALSAWASRFLAVLLFGVGPGDLPTLALAAGVLVLVALVASFVPAFRASSSDPAHVLRGT